MKRIAAAPRERPPRSFWVDPRFAIGIVLVVASVVGVVFVVSSADRTVQVWAARDALSAGDTVDGDDLMLRDVRLGDAGDLYLASAAIPDDGLVLTRTIAAGELVPASAVGSSDGVRVAPIVIQSTGQLPHQIAPGAVVDLWSARLTDDAVYGPPAVLVGSATVVRVLENDGLIVNGTATGVEVLVPRSKIALVLEAIANEDSMSLVPVSLPVGD